MRVPVPMIAGGSAVGVAVIVAVIVLAIIVYSTQQPDTSTARK